MDLADDERVARAVAAAADVTAIEHHVSVTSTNDVVLARLRAGAPPGLVVVADHQTAGRGRRGRAWVDHLDAEHGPTNLAVTMSLELSGPHPGRAPLGAGLAVCAAVAGQGVDAALKWPNDVLAGPGEAKLAGILCEHHLVDGRAVTLVGCGVNVDWRQVQRDGDTVTWTSVAEQRGGPVDRAGLLADLVAALDVEVPRAVDGQASHRAAYDAACVTLGRPVRVDRPGSSALTGRATRIDAAGRLVVAADGREEVLVAGDVVHVRSR